MQTLEVPEMWLNYASNPVLVKAFQFDREGAHRLRLPAGITRDGVDTASAQERFTVKVAIGGNEFLQPVYNGDWIIEKSDGSWCVCAGDIFHQGFSPVETEPRKHLILTNLMP